MDSGITIRRLAPGDEQLVRKLNVMFGRAFDEAETYERESPGDAWFETLLAKEHLVPLAALDGEEVVGGLVAYELDKLERERREMYIYDLAVEERYRRRGIATALINHLRGIAASRGVWVIFIQADYGDHPAIALYDKLGTREEVLHFDIPVE